jgi:hypothetical protein
MSSSQFIDLRRDVSPRNEGRNGPRHSVRAPVLFWWKDEEKVHQYGAGWTRDVNGHGLFVIADRFPPLRSGVKLTINFAALPARPANLRMEVAGQVVRIENGSKGFGVLARTTLLTWKNKSLTGVRERQILTNR